ncbi:MAG: hypothetical protein CMH76_07265 [Nitrospinae bacterium]|nr:hypothetical protein [Nitrospinota bacterium]
MYLKIRHLETWHLETRLPRSGTGPTLQGLFAACVFTGKAGRPFIRLRPGARCGIQPVGFAQRKNSRRVNCRSGIPDKGMR